MAPSSRRFRDDFLARRLEECSLVERDRLDSFLLDDRLVLDESCSLVESDRLNSFLLVERLVLDERLRLLWELLDRSSLGRRRLVPS